MPSKQNKTIVTTTSPEEFLRTVSEKRQQEAAVLIEIMSRVSGQSPVMWGSSIIGFGTYHYKYASGREGDWMKVGFSPRKAKISLYLSCNADDFAKQLERLGKHTRGKGCIYINKLTDSNLEVLEEMVKIAYEGAQDYEAK
ncbi:MAG: DUF1801 domain-containing protein [Pseudomonadales bacterium]|nr:DUF1801 domain-containing protein [Candidatus Woesebacteria bacterium]MCB9801630.1 DUF1801 domain-containing protein [Pseudomonadales bacterium]